MSAATLLLVLAVAAAVWGVVAGILIFETLRRRGENVSFLWIRLMLPAYVHRYGQITKKEQGKRGVLFFHYVVAFNIALAAVLAALILLSA
ncbi:hypothetical protein ACFLU6_11125 [Acidobacteriota bacterium]